MGKWYSRPVLFVRDVARSLDFYVDQLGFDESWRHGDPGDLIVAQVERSGCELILSSQWPENVGSGLVFISLDPDDILVVRHTFERRGAPVRDGWWGYRLMIVEDPDGNQLYFPYGDVGAATDERPEDDASPIHSSH
jgi:catechol 2,3-dioxygenase-like lactoylglutathione lyase family enzyme